LAVARKFLGYAKFEDDVFENNNERYTKGKEFVSNILFSANFAIKK